MTAAIVWEGDNENGNKGEKDLYYVSFGVSDRFFRHFGG
jgi:hypothetical protein